MQLPYDGNRHLETIKEDGALERLGFEYKQSGNKNEPYKLGKGQLNIHQER